MGNRFNCCTNTKRSIEYEINPIDAMNKNQTNIPIEEMDHEDESSSALGMYSPNNK